MHTIVVASRKGGAGKTTLTAHLAVEAQRCGVKRVAVMDADPQGGLSDWWNARKAETPIFALPQNEGTLGAKLERLRKSRFDLVLIDTPPALTDAIAATLTHADLVLIPAKPSPNDLRAIRGTVRLVIASGKPSLFILNMVKPRVRLADEASAVLALIGELAPVMISDRTDYAAAMTTGLTAQELDPTGRAATEMTGLWLHIADRLAGRGGSKRAA